MGQLWSTFCLLLTALQHSASGLDKIKLDTAGNFVDSQGMVLLMHGFNAVQKGPPWYPEQMLNRTQLKMFQSWGINVVRLGVMWTGVMPRKNKVDSNYMKKLELIVDACAEFGIYVLLDMHQDVLSSRFGTYDGLPLWFVEEICEPHSTFTYPWPYSEPPKNWFENYLTYACADCAERLYQNTSGAWHHWSNFWEAVVRHFRHKPNVLGYEMINEPPPSNFYKNPLHALPGYVGRIQLLPVYDYLVKRIRQLDTRTLIFYEPLTYGVFLPAGFLETGTGFSYVPGWLSDPTETERSVLSYHYYCWLLQTVDPRRSMDKFERMICDSILMPSVFRNSRASITQTGGGMFLTEFGLCGPDGNPNSINTVECNAVLTMADKHFQSWAYWDGNFLDETGNPIPTQVKSFIRTYPKKTKGRPGTLTFNQDTGEFYYTFKMAPTLASQQTKIAEIFVPTQVHYPRGPKITVQPATLITSFEDNHLRISVPTNWNVSEDNVIVSITKD
ncbi:Glycoside hydrolase subgroup catalytic core [Paragonimus heterotremus]|uniref:Glycoside hydrolase subgroup catalytic core n=1 Tax=Paragonimus heterotremus TaxID=100268 RepID=A0A8J4SPP6_9TREM|nr:Glycoside hydrolase subgroup catalytic core [Paragonimus heterotremus]